MSDFFTTKGTLTVSIGEGCLSSFQASTLKKGDVVRTTKIAGRPSTLFFNGGRIGSCEVVILGDAFGVRVSSDLRRDRIAEEPGIRDDLIELLPTMIRLGSISVSLAELKGVGIGSLISLGIPFAAEEDCELLVGGIPAARGKVVCLGEEMGMRVTRAYGTSFKEPNIRSSGFLIEEGTPGVKVKDYDFKRPDKFTWATIVRISEIHGYFLRNLAARFPDAVTAFSPAADALLVDQCTYREALEMLPDAEYRRFAAENGTWRPASAEGAPDGRGAARRMILEEEGTRRPVPRDVREQVARFWDEEAERVGKSPVLVYWKGSRAAAQMFDASADRSAALSCLRGGWKNVADLNLRAWAPARGEPDFPALNPYEMVVMVGVKEKGTGKLAVAILYPFLTLEPYLGLLG